MLESYDKHQRALFKSILKRVPLEMEELQWAATKLFPPLFCQSNHALYQVALHQTHPSLEAVQFLIDCLGDDHETVDRILAERVTPNDKRCDFSTTPLHLACVNWTSLPALQRLCHACPHGLLEEDEFGLLPMHRLLMCCRHATRHVGLAAKLYHVLRTCPQAVSRIVPLHLDTALSIACRSIAPSSNEILSTELFMRLHRYDPAALKATNVYGDTVLHCFCRNPHAHQAQAQLQFLLDRYPHALFVSNLAKEYPMHLACRNGLPLDMIKIMSETVVELTAAGAAAVENNDEDDNDNSTTKIPDPAVDYHEGLLIEAIQAGHHHPHHKNKSKHNAWFRLDTILYLMENFPHQIDEASDWRDGFRKEWIPLHYLLELDRSVISDLDRVNLMKKMIPKIDYPGSYESIRNHPLALACSGRRPLSKAIVDCLAPQNPLLFALRHCPLQHVIIYMVKLYPESVHQVDSDGTPLHFALEIATSALAQDGRDSDEMEVVVAFLVKQNPQALSTRDRAGNLPLHVACRNKHNSFDVLRLVSKGHRGLEAWKTVNQQGELPLHCLLQHGMFVTGGIEDALRHHKRCFVEALSTPNAKRDYPIHILLKRASAENKDRLKAILVEWIDLLCPGADEDGITSSTDSSFTDAHGNTPMHVACQYSAKIAMEVLATSHPLRWTRSVNHHKQLPLHTLCRSSSTPKSGGVSKPLHRFCAAQYLIQAWPGSIAQKCARGFLPLQYACMGEQPDSNMVRLLTRDFPDGFLEMVKYNPLPSYPVLSEEEEAIARKYRKDLKVGQNYDIVQCRMARDGVDKKIQDAVMLAAPTTTTPLSKSNRRRTISEGADKNEAYQFVHGATVQWATLTCVDSDTFHEIANVLREHFSIPENESISFLWDQNEVSLEKQVGDLANIYGFSKKPWLFTVRNLKFEFSFNGKVAIGPGDSTPSYQKHEQAMALDDVFNNFFNELRL